MKNTLAIFFLLLTASANATFITSGTLWDNGSGGDWGFSTTGGLVTIDILSWELDPGFDNRQFLTVRDLNGDGEAAFFDSYITLFKDNTIIAENDDAFGLTFPDPLPGLDDGSIFQYDSYLSLVLAPGDYKLKVSTVSNQSPLTCLGAIGAQCGGSGPIANDHGDYSITWGGDVSVTQRPVSAPATSVLLGLSTFMLLNLRRTSVRLTR